MFKATIKNKQISNNSIIIDVEFSDGETAILESIDTSKQIDFKKWIESRIVELNDAKELFASLDVGEYISESEVDVTKTEFEINQDEYNKNYYKLKKLKDCVNLGIIAEDNKDYLVLKELVKIQFDIKY